MKKMKRTIGLASFEELNAMKDAEYWRGKTVQERMVAFYQVNKLCFDLAGYDYDNMKVKRVIGLRDSPVK
jgi:hypothetical protein